MYFSGKAGVVLRPVFPSVPLDEIFAGWKEASFHPGECRRRLEQLMEQKKIPPAFFRPEEIERGGLAATEALLFDNFASPAPQWLFSMQKKVDGKVTRAGTLLPAEAVSDVAQLLAAAGSDFDVEELRGVVAASLPERLARVFSACLTRDEDEAAYGAWPVVDAPGIYRREHASLVIRSRTTTLVIDPQMLNPQNSSNFSQYPGESGALAVDAILVTHHHNDHWHLPTILRYAAGRDIPIIVPEVPRPNLLTIEDFAASLGVAGLRGVALPWGSTMRVGDIEIDALPFYGEQPTRGAPGAPPFLRLWGNCYRVTTPDFSALLLVDGGEDPLGSMVEAVARSTERRGPADVVLSNCRVFQESPNPGLPEHSMTLPMERLREIHEGRLSGRGKSITLGPDGVAEACIAARARYFLPYAHMFNGIGRDTDEGILRCVRSELSARGGSTEVLDWDCGDRALLEANRRLVVRPAESAAAA